MHLHAGAFFINFTDLTDVGEIQLRVHALGIHIHRDIHDVRIARALAVSKEGPFHTLRACQEAQLGGGRRRTAVVVRMQADDDAVAVFDMAAEIFDLIRVMVRGAHLHRVGEVQDQFVLRRGLQDVHDRLADGDCIVHLGPGEALRRILIADVHPRPGDLFVGELFDELCAVDVNVDDALHIGLKHHFAL